jgi:4,5-DOPA dioxygenase extradiol
MNAIEDTLYVREWQRIGKILPKPRAILMISAHWITHEETRISTAENPEMIYDMYGFPPELYQVRYQATGSSMIAKKIQEALPEFDIHEDRERGLDHGAWSILLHLFPEYNIPVVCLSIDYSKPPLWHYEL